MATAVAIGDVNLIQQNSNENVLPVNANTSQSNNESRNSSQNPLVPSNFNMQEDPWGISVGGDENDGPTKEPEEMVEEPQKTEIAGPSNPIDAEIYGDKRIFEIMSPNESQEGIEIADTAFASYSQSNSYSSNELFPEIEQFPSTESDIESENRDVPISSESQQVYEKRILHLMNKVSELELEKEELQVEKDDLRSKLNVQHEQDVQDMYQDPYSNPFATPTKASGGIPSFLEAATNNLSQQQSAPTIAPIPTTSTDNANQNAELHRELTELRMKNQSLQTDLDTSDRVKLRLKKILKTLQKEDKQKVDLLNALTNNLEETKEREAILKKELNECKTRIEGYELAEKIKYDSMMEGESMSEQAPSSPLRSTRNSFFAAKTEKEKPIGDVATALVVSQRQNEALEAFNKELEQQNENLQKKCDALTEKYGLSVPKDGDAKGNQIYLRYLEMKSSLSSLSVVLEEAQEENATLTEKVKSLESELQQKPEHPNDNGTDTDATAIDSLRSIFNGGAESSSSISTEQETALKHLVEKLETQILGYRDAEERHEEIRAQLEHEASELRRELEAVEIQKPSLSHDLVQSFQQLESKIGNPDSSELTKELGSLKLAMEAAALESANLLNKLEHGLEKTREEVQNERNKFVELSAKHEALRENIDKDDKEGILEENAKLVTQIASLKNEREELRLEVEQKSHTIEKSEKRVAAKHEQALQLNETNASLRDGIQRLKTHLSTISDQTVQTEEKYVAAKTELKKEREKAHELQIARETLQSKLSILRKSINGTFDEESCDKIELSASLEANKRELSLEKERIEALVDENKQLEVALEKTQKDLGMQLNSKTKTFMELEGQITKLQRELEASEHIVAAANNKIDELSISRTKDSRKLQKLLESTKDLLATEKTKSQGLETLKAALESRMETMKNDIEELQSRNASLEEEIESSKKRSNSEVPLQFAELEKLLVTTQEELNGEEQQVEELENQVDNLTMQIEELETNKNDLEISLEDVRQELQRAVHKNTELENLVGIGENPSAPSDDVRMRENEMLLGNTKRALEDARKQIQVFRNKVENLKSEVENSQQINAQTLKECETYEAINLEMAENIRSLETQLVTLTKENQSLLERSASLTEKDQLQKASLMSSNQEINSLMDTVTNFQNRFTSLAKQIADGQAEKEAMEKEHGKEGAKWRSKRVELEEYITRLQSELDEMQRNYDGIENENTETAAKRESEWQRERMALSTRIAHLENEISKTQEKLSEPSSDEHYQKINELEQDIQLLDITLADKTHEHLQALAELDSTNQKLQLCGERLETCEEELKSSRAEHDSLVLKSATEQASLQEKILDLETELHSAMASIEGAKQERDSADTEHGVLQTNLVMATDALGRSQNEIIAREKKIQEIEVMMATELQNAMEKHQMLQSKYDSCLEDLKACKSVLSEKEEILSELKTKEADQRNVDEEVRKQKLVLKNLTDGLNEAHVRESKLENMLAICQEELEACKDELVGIKTKAAADKDVFNDVIKRLNRANENLIAKNQKLQEETTTLRTSGEHLKQMVNNLQNENDFARAAAGVDNNTSNISSTSVNSQGIERENHLMKDLLATSQVSVTEAKKMQKILSTQIQAATKREAKLKKDVSILRNRNAEMAKRLEEQEIELDEFENDFALARNDARKVVEELRAQLNQLEKRNQQLEAASGGLNSIEELKGKLKQLVMRNKRLEKEIATCKARERRYESELGLEPRRSR